MPGERKSVEPMAAMTAPDRTAAQHQSLLHFVGQSPWSDEKLLAKVGEMVLPAIERHSNFFNGWRSIPGTIPATSQDFKLTHCDKCGALFKGRGGFLA
jgi:hypothetical protein